VDHGPGADATGLYVDFLHDHVSSHGFGGQFLPDHHSITPIQQYHHLGLDCASLHLGVLHLPWPIVVLRRQWFALFRAIVTDDL
jgi:hypothetical protein